MNRVDSKNLVLVGVAVFLVLGLAVTALFMPLRGVSGPGRGMITTSATFSDGSSVSLTARTEGHSPGDSMDVTVAVQNGRTPVGDSTQDHWIGGYCIVLADRERVLATFEGRTFDLVPEERVEDTHTIRLPENLQTDAPYALAAHVPGTGPVSLPIWSGEAGEEPSGFALPGEDDHCNF